MGATDSFGEFKTTAAQKFVVFKNAFRSREGLRYLIQTHDTALNQHGHLGSRVTLGWSDKSVN